MNSTFINEILLLVVAAFIGGFAARSLKFPPVVGYLVSGVIFGVVGKTFIPSFENIFKLSEIGVALLLFTLGFEINLSLLKRMSRKIIYVSVLQVVLTALFIFPILLLFHFSLQISILFAILFSFSSTAVILKILEEKGMVNDFPGNNVFIILLIQDLFLVPVIFLMPLIFTSDFSLPSTLVSFLITAIKPLIVFLIIYFLGRFLLSKLFQVLFRYPQQELTILATIFTAAISIGLLTYAGLPQSIAAFFAGVLISDEGKNLAPLSSIKPIRDILLVLFFVMIGMLVDGTRLITMLPVILTASVLVMLIKFFVTFFILRFFKFLPSANIFISSYLSNIGEFAVVVAQLAFLSKFITQRDYESLLSFFVISLISVPITIGITKRIFEKYKKSNFIKNFMGDSHYFTRSSYDEIKDHVIILGHGRVGKEVRNLLDMGEVPYVVVDFDKRIIDSLTKNMKNAIYGDPADADVLRSAGIGKAKIMVIAVPESSAQKSIIKIALNLNPKLMILCRSHVDEDKYELVNLGVNTIVIPEFEAGLRIGKKVLELLGFSDKNTVDLLRRLRKFHLVN